MRFKVTNCFNTKLKAYINNHDFTDELAKYGIVSTNRVYKGNTYLILKVTPVIYVLKGKDMTTCGIFCIRNNDGTIVYEGVLPTYSYTEPDGTKLYYYVPPIPFTSIIEGFWANCESYYDVMLLPMTIMGRNLREMLIAMFNNLGTITTTNTLTLGSYALSQLTDEDKKIATDKGWTLA